MPKKTSNNQDYGAKDIMVLEGLDPVRKRPAMYIGSTGPDGLHHLVWEVLDNSIDEAMAEYASTIEVSLLPNNRVQVIDDGRGIPVEKHPQTKKSTLETVLTILHAGGKFGGKAYQVSGGLHGVGISVVNALSIYLKAEVCREGIHYEQEYSRGKPKSGLKKVGTCKGSGTRILFEADPEVFKEISFDAKRIINHLRQQAYLTSGTKITFIDAREKEKKSYVFYFEGGLASLVPYLIKGRTPTHENIFYSKGEKEGMVSEVAFQYTQEFETLEESFANNIYTKEGGTHLTGFRSALTRTLNEYAKKNNFLKGEEALTGEDVREGLTAVVSVKIREPQFEGQTKAKLGNPEAKNVVETLTVEALTDYLERNPQDGRNIIEKCLLASKARKAAKAARQTVLRKGILEGLALPGKLADCSSKDPEDSELYIVEGDSAGGCFSGDTKVALADGRSLSFKELVGEAHNGKQNYCYTFQDDGSIGIEKILHPRKTKAVAKVLKVTLDNKESIVCTPDHQFLLRDGTYKQAKDLMPADSLMPLYRQISRLGKRITIQGYEMVHQPNEDRLQGAVQRYNHKVVRVEAFHKRMDVYDLEVPGTHNFALASGVFVHNSAKQARDRRFQAILPLRGKILNVERARLDKILSSKEIRSLVIAMGAAIAEDFDIEKVRYHRIIIMTDADVDGSHIRALLLTLFYRYFKPVIERGYLYIAQPPLFQIQQGKNIHYAFDDQERDKIITSLKEAKGLKTKQVSKKTRKAGEEEEVTEKVMGVSIQRYKGLGEMNPDQLWKTTMDPKGRLLAQVNVEDAREADKIFDVLMGNEVSPRKKFIQTYAKSVKNLDI